jgi:hypothetical protein
MLRTTLVVSLLLTTVSIASAQNRYVLEFYGDGVHAFHRGEMFRAQEQFDKAINHGSRDPRVYYYRALVHMQNGDEYSAEQDIRTGTTFELQGLGTYDIGRALERVQGPQRLELEEVRLNTKLALGGRSVLDAPQPLLDPKRIDERPMADDLPMGDRPQRRDDPFRDDNEDAADPTDLDLDATMPDAGAVDAAPGAAVPDAPPVDAADEDPFGAPDSDDDPFGDGTSANDAAANGASDDPFADDGLNADPFD